MLQVVSAEGRGAAAARLMRGGGGERGALPGGLFPPSCFAPRAFPPAGTARSRPSARPGFFGGPNSPAGLSEARAPRYFWRGGGSALGGCPAMPRTLPPRPRSLRRVPRGAAAAWEGNPKASPRRRELGGWG